MTETAEDLKRARREQIACNAPVTLVDANESLHQNPEATRFAKPHQLDCGTEIFPVSLLVKELARLSVMYADALIKELDGGGQ